VYATEIGLAIADGVKYLHNEQIIYCKANMSSCRLACNIVTRKVFGIRAEMLAPRRTWTEARQRRLSQNSGQQRRRVVTDYVGGSSNKRLALVRDVLATSLASNSGVPRSSYSPPYDSKLNSGGYS
jgi:dGTP triphosphohydrolase